jgi:hypothetical protein
LYFIAVLPKWFYQNGTNGNGTEKIGLKHGYGIFEHGTIKKRNKKNRFGARVVF